MDICRSDNLEHVAVEALQFGAQRCQHEAVAVCREDERFLHGFEASGSGHDGQSQPSVLFDASSSWRALRAYDPPAFQRIQPNPLSSATSISVRIWAAL